MILSIDLSPIQGMGVFTNIDLSDGYTFGPICDVAGVGKYFIRLERNIIGKYINHADEPNAEIFLKADGLWVMLREDLTAGTEITLNYMGDYDWCQDVLDAESERMNITLLLF